MSADRITELTFLSWQFDYVKCNSWPFRFSPFCAVLWLPLSFVNPWNLHPFTFTAVPNNHKLPFSAAQAFRISAWQNRQQACPFPAGVVTLVFGEVEHFVHLITWNLNSCLCPCGPCGWIWLRSLLGTTHDYLGLNWVLAEHFNLFLLFHSCHQLVPIWSLILPPCPSVMCCGVQVCALCWLGPFRRVGWFWRSVCSLPPCAVLAFCPSFVSAFFFLLPFRVVPAPAGCVCVCNI